MSNVVKLQAVGVGGTGGGAQREAGGRAGGAKNRVVQPP